MISPVSNKVDILNAYAPVNETAENPAEAAVQAEPAAAEPVAAVSAMPSNAVVPTENNVKTTLISGQLQSSSAETQAASEAVSGSAESQENDAAAGKDKASGGGGAMPVGGSGSSSEEEDEETTIVKTIRMPDGSVVQKTITTDANGNATTTTVTISGPKEDAAAGTAANQSRPEAD